MLHSYLKRGFSIILLFTICMCNISTTAAAETKDAAEVRTSINELNENVGVVEVISEKAFNSTLSSSWVYKSYTVSRYFYLIESGETVANYSLEATFRYDSTAGLAECRATQVTKSAEDGWIITGVGTDDNASGNLGGAVGNFELYKKGIFNNTLNNTDEIRIWCDSNGKISTN